MTKGMRINAELARQLCPRDMVRCINPDGQRVIYQVIRQDPERGRVIFRSELLGITFPVTYSSFDGSEFVFSLYGSAHDYYSGRLPVVLRHSGGDGVSLDNRGTMAG